MAEDTMLGGVGDAFNNFMQRMQQDPNFADQMGMLAKGLMQNRQPGQSTASLVGDAWMGSVNYKRALDEQSRRARNEAEKLAIAQGQFGLEKDKFGQELKKYEEVDVPGAASRRNMEGAHAELYRAQARREDLMLKLAKQAKDKGQPFEPALAEQARKNIESRLGSTGTQLTDEQWQDAYRQEYNNLARNWGNPNYILPVPLERINDEQILKFVGPPGSTQEGIFIREYGPQGQQRIINARAGQAAAQSAEMERRRGMAQQAGERARTEAGRGTATSTRQAVNAQADRMAGEFLNNLEQGKTGGFAFAVNNRLAKMASDPNLSPETRARAQAKLNERAPDYVPFGSSGGEE